MVRAKFIGALLIISILSLGMGGGNADAQNHPDASPDSPHSFLITPELINQIGGPTNAIARQGSYAYVGVGTRLHILDVTNPVQPVLIGRTEVLADFMVNDVAVQGNYAYITASGLHVIDISNPATPREVGFCSTPAGKYLAVEGNYAYITADDHGISFRHGLYIVDISNPAAPIIVYFGQPLAGISNPSITSYNDVAVSGNYAYVTVTYTFNIIFHAYLEIFNISNPVSPTVESIFTLTGIPEGVAVAGNYAYVAVEGSGLHIINISDPAVPVETGFLAIPAEDIVMAGNYAYVTGDHRLTIVDIFIPATPTSVGFYDTQGLNQCLALVGGYVYLADNLTGLHIIDISNPASPVEVGLYPTPIPGFAWGLELAGKYLYVADRASGMRILNISEPAAPQEVGVFDTAGEAFDVTVAGNYAYIAEGWDGWQIVDISNLAAPIEVGFFDPPYSVDHVAVANSYAYIVDIQGGLYINDISNPAMPVEVGYYDFYGYIRDLSVAGNYVFATWGSGLTILDVTDSYAPIEIGFYATGADAQDLQVVGNYAYVAAGSSLHIVDISNPSDPIAVGKCDLPDNGNYSAVYGMLVARNYAYVFSFPRGEYIIDISDPTAPTTIGFYDNPHIVGDIAVAGNYVYLSYGYEGLAILRSLTDKVTASITVNGGSLASSDGDTVLTFPSGAFTQTVNVTYRQPLYQEHRSYWASIGHNFDITAVYSETAVTADLAPGQTFTITTTYSDSQIGSAIEDTLGLFNWDGVTWEREPSSTIDTVNNIITATPSHLSLWVILGDTNRFFMPMVLK